MAGNDQRTVVVTGGSRGIGRAICVAFAAPGTHIFFNYVSGGDAVSRTEDMVREKGAAVTAMKVNVALADEVDGFFDQILKQTGRVDVLVNNAGITRDGLMVRMKEKDWDDVLDTNLKGSFHCARAAARIMMKQRCGRIINLSSVAGVMGNAGQVNYASSKAGMIGLTKASAKELAPRGITVNAVAPGWIETDMTASLPLKVQEAMVSQIPLGRVGQPEDVAEVVKFLASEAAGYITGQVIHVSGGMYI
ncbi:MAG: 3-oxoacyl-[acyl-carrier-protein] reductase [Desulfobacterales bacterium]|jgi:3-oxoacyl-[acyl-carrier protein] reductase|nr:3-oxoacyl-[acyl-carrier-protein] reductase [Desulfobacterales bacterium]